MSPHKKPFFLLLAAISLPVAGTILYYTNSAFASEASDAAFAATFPNDAFELQSSPFVDGSHANAIISVAIRRAEETTGEFSLGACNANYTSCVVYYNGEGSGSDRPTREITIQYNYDPVVQAEMEQIAAALNAGPNVYYLSESDFAGFLQNYAIPEHIRHINALADDQTDFSPAPPLTQYSSQLRTVLHNLDIDFKYSSPEFGDNFDYEEELNLLYQVIGRQSVLEYDGTLYPSAVVTKPIRVIAESVITIDQSNEDIEQAVLDKLQQLGITYELSVSEESAISTYVENLKDYARSVYDSYLSLQNEYESTDAYADAVYDQFVASEDAPAHFLVRTDLLPNMYQISFRYSNNGWSGTARYYVVVAPEETANAGNQDDNPPNTDTNVENPDSANDSSLESEDEAKSVSAPDTGAFSSESSFGNLDMAFILLGCLSLGAFMFTLILHRRRSKLAKRS